VAYDELTARAARVFPLTREAIAAGLARPAPAPEPDDLHVIALREGARVTEAAVLVPIVRRGPEVNVLFTQRTAHLDDHAGQISFPGGRVEAHDATREDTALRETEEEVGIPPSALRVLGELDDVSTMVSGFIVRPFVAVMDRPLAAIPSDAEVARVLEVTVADLLRADVALPADPAPLALRYPLAGEDVWGATARILRIFCRVTRCALG